MEYEQERGRLALAGRRLLEAGLVARTWGNLSVRVGQTQFLITPSGMDYERLRPEDMALVSLEDLKSEGPHRPSSEKAMHAEIYRLRPEAGFLIHTHQTAASCLGLSGQALAAPGSAILGPRVPCARYALPSTKALARNVREAAASEPRCPAVLLRSHGALLMGPDEEAAFAAAAELERVCAARLPQPGPDGTADFGSSERLGTRFRLVRDGVETIHEVADERLQYPASLHAEIYRAYPVRCLLAERGGAAVRASRSGALVRPYLDDLAQIAGADLRSVEPDRAVRALRGRAAVYLTGMGALCAGESRDEAEAVREILRKDALARLCAERTPGCRPVPPADAAVQRLFYVKKYAARRNAEGAGC